ncbi:MAG: HlyD family efflux transporter periplasmic adaptor subunit [Burkholderiaceae bacterium]
MNAPSSPAQVTATVVRAGAQSDLWRLYAYLQERARAAASVAELRFSLANEPWQLMPYRQGLVWEFKGRKPVLSTVSGLARLGEDSPYSVWLGRFGRYLAQRIGKDPARDPFFVMADDLPRSLADGWQEWMPDYLLVQPVVAPDQRLLGIAAYALEVTPSEAVQTLLVRSIAAYAHAWAALVPRRRGRRARRWLGWSLAFAALSALAIPVRLSVLAPAEIIGLDALAVAAPMDGVIARFHVRPNDRVGADELLFTLDDTTLRNRREIAAKQLQVARADALAAEQRAFGNDASRAELASLRGKVAEREAELASVQEMLARIEVRSPGPGVIQFGDISDWQGKPVVTGERVATLADPDRAGVLLWMPVADAINLEPGARVRLFLDVAPLSPLTAEVFETSYQASAAPGGGQAYRLRAHLDRDQDLDPARVRIGLKGTAKVYGERASLGYYLFRRPLAALRAFFGF